MKAEGYKRGSIGKRIIRGILLGGLLGIGLCSCGKEKEQDQNGLLTVNVYDSHGAHTGQQEGWYGEILKTKFNVELEFVESAEQADLLIGCNEQEETALAGLMERGELLDMEKLLKDSDLMDMEKQLRDCNSTLSSEGIYAIPTHLSRLSEETPSEEREASYGIFLDWDCYRQLEYPRIKNRDELLAFLVEEKERSGGKRMGLSLYKGEVGDTIKQASQVAAAAGQETFGFVTYKQNVRESEDILKEGSGFEQAVRWLNEAYRAGVLDTGSAAQNRTKMEQKYKEHRVLLTFDGSFREEGYLLAPVENMRPVSFGVDTSGTLQEYVAVKASAKEPERIVKLVEWLYSAEGIMLGGTDTGMQTAGMMGLTWCMQEGKPMLTEFGSKVLEGEELPMPSNWMELWQNAYQDNAAGILKEIQIPEETKAGEAGTELQEESGAAGTEAKSQNGEETVQQKDAVAEEAGTWQEGRSRLSLEPMVSVEVGPSGFPYNRTLWSCYGKEKEQASEDSISALKADWCSFMEANYEMDYLVKNGRLSVIPAYKSYEAGAEKNTERQSCIKVIEQYLWRLLYAESKEQYEALWADMNHKLSQMGYQELMEADRELLKSR